MSSGSTTAGPAPLVLEGARLRLRHWRPEDCAPLAALNADPAVMRHFPAPLDRAASDAWAGRLAEHMDRHGWGFWVVERRGAPGLVGVAGLLHLAWEPTWEHGHAPAVEIGWRIAAGFQRRGYAEEAARLALSAGFGPIGLEEVVAFTVPPNAPSWRLMAKLGMRPAGTFEHPRLPEGHPLRTHLLYRITRAAWRMRQPDQPLRNPA